MDKIEWSDGFSVGVEAIDNQHKMLISMTNRLIDTPNVDSNSAVITKLLDDMIAYATTHFVDEERLMQLHDYPEFESHQQQHVDFMKKTAEFCSVEEGTMVVHDPACEFQRLAPFRGISQRTRHRAQHPVQSPRQAGRERG